MDGYGIGRGKPEFPFVIPTLLYRNVLKYPWGWFISCWRFLYELSFSDETASASTATRTASRLAKTFAQTVHTQETFEPDIGFGADEVI
jgi:hypothetical protein